VTAAAVGKTPGELVVRGSRRAEAGVPVTTVTCHGWKAAGDTVVSSWWSTWYSCI